MRQSIVQDNDIKRCFISHQWQGDSGEPLEKHHIMNGSAYRGDAEKIGALVWLCSRCHHWAHTTGEGARYLRKLKAEAQTAYEEDHTRAEWMFMFHKNYRED